MQDEQIVQMFWNRDEAAIAATREKYGSYLFVIAQNILSNREDSMECVNDTYLAAWNSIPPHEPKTYLYAFLARITRHISLNRCRELSRLKRSAFICRLSDELEQCIPAPDDVECRMDDLALSEAVNGFLRALDEEKRNVFIRRYWYLDPIAAISRRFALSESKVKTMLFRCRRQLREHLEKEGYTI